MRTGSRALLGRIREREPCRTRVRLLRLCGWPTRNQAETTHVDASGRRNSDAGSIPAASTNFPCYFGTSHTHKSLCTPAALQAIPTLAINADGAQAIKTTFQKRHVITHDLGVVDRKYLEHDDGARELGRDVPLTAAEVAKTADLVELEM